MCKNSFSSQITSLKNKSSIINKNWETFKFCMSSISYAFSLSIWKVLKISCTVKLHLLIISFSKVTQSLKAFVRVASNVETSIVAVERLKEYEEEPREAPWTVPNDKLIRNWPHNPEIIFHQYCVRYRPGLDLALKNVNFSIKSSEKIGIVGRTGSGKSSLTLSLFR